MDKYNPKIHHRKSIRLNDYDYSQVGFYFVTICCQHRACLFGGIVDDEMILNDAGKMVANEWLKLKIRFKNIELQEYVVMPNHFHGIVEIVGATLVVAQNNATTYNVMGNIRKGQPQGIAPTDKTVAHTDKTVAHSDKTVAHSDKTVAHSDKTVAHSDKTVAHSDKTVAHMNKTIAHMDKTIAHTDKTIAHTDKTVAHSDKTNAHMDKTIAHTDKTIAHSDKTVAHMDKTVAHTDKTVAHTDKTVAHTDKTIPHTDKTIGDMVGAFESITTVEYIRCVKNNHWQPFDGKLWQRNFWEHIIRNENEYRRITQYILDNPKKWAMDKLNGGDGNQVMESPVGYNAEAWMT